MEQREQRDREGEIQSLFTEMDDLVDKIERAWSEFDRAYGPTQGGLGGGTRFVPEGTPSMLEMRANVRSMEQRWREIAGRVLELQRQGVGGG